jgi:hypothetical protein
MKPADVRSALATRRTVRITYVRSSDSYRVDVVSGDTVIDYLLGDLVTEELAEVFAGATAHALGLDITRLDVP